MNKKNGFTLIEIIVVIGLIGILMVLVVPNVTKTFESSKKSAFAVQAQRVLKEMKDAAVGQFTEGMSLNQPVMISNLDEYSSFADNLRLKNNDIKYLAYFYGRGLLTIAITDGKYCYSDFASDINYANLTFTPIKNIDESKIVKDDKIECSENEPLCYCAAGPKPNLTFTISGDEYVYWTNNSVSSSGYPSTATTTYDISKNSTFIRTTLLNGNAVKHESCLSFGHSYICVDGSYWKGSVSSTISYLSSKFGETFGSYNVECDYNDANKAYCYIESNVTTKEYCDSGYTQYKCYISSNGNTECKIGTQCCGAGEHSQVSSTRAVQEVVEGHCS